MNGDEKKISQLLNLRISHQFTITCKTPFVLYKCSTKSMIFLSINQKKKKKLEHLKRYFPIYMMIMNTFLYK